MTLTPNGESVTLDTVPFFYDLPLFNALPDTTWALSSDISRTPPLIDIPWSLVSRRVIPKNTPASTWGGTDSFKIPRF